MGLTPDYAAAAAPPASPRAYALLFAIPDARDALTALYAIDAEIAAATARQVEHSVAHTKLGWWRGEVDRLQAGRPEHPVSRALLAAAPRPADYALLHERLAAADLRLVRYAPGSIAELDALLYRSHGALQQLAAQLQGGAEPPVLASFGARLGRGLGLVEAIRDLRQDAIDGAPRVPLDALTAAGIDLDALPRSPPPAALPGVLGTLGTRARQAFDEALETLPAAARRAQAHGRILAALHRALLDELERAQFDVTTRRSVHPLRQLWLAWRTARRA